MSANLTLEESVRKREADRQADEQTVEVKKKKKRNWDLTSKC